MGVDCLIERNQDILRKGKNVDVNNMTILLWESKMGGKMKESIRKLLPSFHNGGILLKLD